MSELTRAWNGFSPDLAFAEGGVLDLDTLTSDQVVRRFGEFGMVYLPG